MTNRPAERQVVEERSLIGGALSYEFSDCSIAAADLNQRVENSMRQDTKQASLFIIGDEDTAQPVRYKNVGYHNDFTIDGVAVNLLLVERRETVEESREVTTRKWLIPRHVQRTARKEVLKDDPFLAMVIGADVALTIASFARRKDGKCSYVQLGQEMQDDNFFVTAADEESSRHDLIEQLRTLVTGRGYSTDPKIKTKVQQFINQQVKANRPALDQAYEQQLVRHSFRRIDKSFENNLLTIVGEEQSGPQPYSVSTIIPTCILEDGRSVELVLAQPQQSDNWLGDRLDLLAITRGSVALPLATMSSQSMKVELIDGGGITPTAQKRLVRDLLYTVVARPKLVNFKEDDEWYNADGLEGVSAEIAQYCYEAGLLATNERRGEYEPHKVAKVEPETKQKLDTFFAYPNPDYAPFPITTPLGVVLARLGRQWVGDRQLLGRLQVDRKFTKLLGEARRCDEALIHFAGRLAFKQDMLRATFPDVQIGKTRASAIIGAAAVANNGTFELSVKGRPASMPDEPMKPLFNMTLDPTRPFFGYEDELDATFNEARVEEIVDTLRRIFAVQGKK